ncbi:unnamed protein product [Effrenium voratum]|uniref:Tudor domain-containing protein n=1 Tax=Effrenium voratum TaxID=2562239 RepID=A0AA36HTG0_9DINO|nr:unnamed protein product [Effrenium voratum]
MPGTQRWGRCCSPAFSISGDLQWILALFSASLLDASEVGPDDAADLRSVEALLATSEAPKEAVETVPAAGDEVWACWPGDGRWFRAKVTRVSGRVEIAWLRRGSEGTGQEDEYLSSTGCDELQFTRLPPASVSAAKERPNPVVQEADRWQEQLSRVEDCGARFRTMRAVCQKLSSRSSEALREDPLQGLADQLTALRKENEARISSLLNVAEERASVGGGINEQLACSTEGFQAEIDSMKQEQQVLQTRLDTLRKERQELAEKLQAMDEQILVVTAACKEAAQRENQVRASAQRVSVELQRELSMEEVEARKVGDRQRLLMEATAASRDIEGLLATRAEAATARRAAQEELRQQPPKAAKACLQSEKDRGRALEELMAGWHSAIWGPKAKELAADPGALSALRALHARAGGQLQQAWKETVQLAAECLGDTSALGDASEDISKAAERYKEMLKEVKGNVERMKVLEAERAKLAKETGGEKPQDAAQSEAAQDPKASPETLPEGKVASVLAETSHVPEPGTPAAEDDAE